MFQHEHVVVHRGPRSGLPIVVAIHSTALGDAVGGCRLWSYPDWRDGMADALALSEAMTLKCATAGLDFGGAKAVIALPPGTALSPERRRDVFLDFGDTVQSLGGRYRAGEDVGTTAADMWVARERTDWVYCLPERHGGTGEPSELTAVGAFASIEATWQHLTGSPSLAGRRVTVIGLGQVGGRLARRLADAGAELTVTDIDTGHRELATELGARWVEPDAAVTTEADILVPAALGGLLSHDIVRRLRCAAIVGPANNQLADDTIAEELATRGILWAPDFVVNAGGVIHGVVLDVDGGTPEQAYAAAQAIGSRLTDVFRLAHAAGTTPYTAALDIARRRVAERGGRAA